MTDPSLPDWFDLADRLHDAEAEVARLRRVNVNYLHQLSGACREREWWKAQAQAEATRAEALAAHIELTQAFLASIPVPLPLTPEGDR